MVRAAIAESLRMNRSIVFVMLAYIASALALGRVAGFDVNLWIYTGQAITILISSVSIVVVPIVLFNLIRYRPEHPFRFVYQLLVKDMLIIERLAGSLPCVVLFLVFSSAFTSIKSAIPFLNPYGLDPLFARLDSLIHGGHAWELIHPFLATPLLTAVLNVSYNIWLVLLWIFFTAVSVMVTHRELREQYLLTFLGCWIVLGSIAAIGLSSVGPCFYGLLYSADPYAPLMDYLRSANEQYSIWALNTQEMLWHRHVTSSTGLGSGISAMPSVHVAVATLNAMLLSRLSRTLGALGWTYLAMILIGSVHLGWHYAIDGYVSIVAVVLIWRAAGWWVARKTERVPLAAASA